MKKFLTLTLSLALIFFLTACGNSAQNSESKGSAQAVAATSDTPKDTSNKKALIVYYSRTGDNYEVGEIAKGNTHIVADFIAERVDADIFEIQPVKPYPANYRECTEVAKAEKEADARPKIVGTVEDFDDYDTIFLGYPVWWSDLPMLMYTFLESYDFNGKTIIPFCTSASNSFIGGDYIKQYAKGATVREGLGIRGKRCQDSPESVRQDVDKWLNGLGF